MIRRRFVLTLGLCLAALPAFAADPVALRVVAINDFHGNLEPVPGEGEQREGGAVALAATLARLRAGAAHTLFVSSGDLVGASPLPSALAHDAPTLNLFHHLGLQANAIGNHELDVGAEALRRQQALAGFPFLSANLVDAASGKPVFAPYRIVEVEGVRVAFVGATVRTALKPLEPELVPGLRIDDEAEALNAQAALLRAQGVHALVALLHEGAGAQGAVVAEGGCGALAGPAREIAGKLAPDFDLVLSAHTHARYACRVDGRWLLQAGANGRYLAVADLKLDRGTGEVLEVVARNEAVSGGTPVDPEVATLVDNAVAAAAKIASRPVAWLGTARVSATPDGAGGSPLGRLVANAQALAAFNRGAQFACTNPSSVPKDLVASAADGNATYADARAVQPYGNQLKLLPVTGAQLRALFEQQWREADPAVLLSCSQELSFKLDPKHRIVPGSLVLSGKALGDSDSATVAVNSYLARGGQGFSALAGIAASADAGLDLDALLEYFSARMPPRCKLIASAQQAGMESSCPGMKLIAFVTPRVQRYLAQADVRFMYELTPAQIADGLQIFDEVLAAAEAGRDLGAALPAFAREGWRKPHDVLITSGQRGVSVSVGGGYDWSIEAQRDEAGRVVLSGWIL